MYCPNCGRENAADNRLCENCGYDLTPVTGGGRTKHAGFWLRFLAWIIDYIIIGVVTSIFYIPSVFLLVNITYAGFILWFLFYMVFVIAVPWLYSAFMESSSKQATPGKMVVGVIVTDEAGNRISFARATGRYFAEFLSAFLLYIGYLMIAFTRNKQGLHDIVAGTYVIKK